MRKYFLVPMSFLNYDFEALKAEYYNHGKIMWQVPGTVKEGKIKKNAQMPNLIKENDIIYFYVCDLPSKSDGRKARILLRGIVKETPRPLEYKEVYFVDNPSASLIIGFSIGDLRTLRRAELEDDRCYSKEILLKDYAQIYPQGKRWPSSYTDNLNPQLIRDLEQSFKQREEPNDFIQLIKHFNRKCFFENDIAGNHKTFKRKNNTDYFELHHFIPKSVVRNNKNLIDLIDDPANQFWLCCNCHRRIHNGTTDDIERMLEILWENPKTQELLRSKNFSSLINVRNDMETFNWIKRKYNLDVQDSNNESY